MRWWIRDTGWQIHNSGSSFQVTNLIFKATHDFSTWKGARFSPKKMLTRRPSYFLYWYLHPRRCWVLNGWYDDKGPYATSVWVEKTQFSARCHQVSLQYQLPITSYITISLSISRTRFPTHLAEWLGGSPFYKPPGVVTLNHPETH